MSRRACLRAASAALALIVALAAAGAQAQRGGINVPGDFDFYVLALSWSPAYCEAEGTARDSLQCGSGRPYGFVVHGLWPQYERGWPEFCNASPSRAPEQAVRDALDITPSAGLVRHQWEKHGTCSGLTPEGYFETARRALGRVAVPAPLAGGAHPPRISPDGVAAAFREANPGLPEDGIAVTCDRQRLREVRICLDRSLTWFRSCPQVARRACGLDSVTVPAIR